MIDEKHLQLRHRRTVLQSPIVLRDGSDEIGELIRIWTIAQEALLEYQSMYVAKFMHAADHPCGARQGGAEAALYCDFRSRQIVQLLQRLPVRDMTDVRRGTLEPHLSCAVAPETLSCKSA